MAYPDERTMGLALLDATQRYDERRTAFVVATVGAITHQAYLGATASLRNLLSTSNPDLNDADIAASGAKLLDIITDSPVDEASRQFDTDNISRLHCLGGFSVGHTDPGILSLTRHHDPDELRVFSYDSLIGTAVGDKVFIEKRHFWATRKTLEGHHEDLPTQEADEAVINHAIKGLRAMNAIADNWK